VISGVNQTVHKSLGKIFLLLFGSGFVDVQVFAATSLPDKVKKLFQPAGLVSLEDITLVISQARLSSITFTHGFFMYFFITFPLLSSIFRIGVNSFLNHPFAIVEYAFAKSIGNTSAEPNQIDAQYCPFSLRESIPNDLTKEMIFEGPQARYTIFTAGIFLELFNAVETFINPLNLPSKFFGV
jgi:hypothetical protein